MNPALLPDYAQNHGFWLVENEIVFSKLKSVLRAQERNTTDVRFYYYDHVFDSYDWTKPSTLSLPELYVKRAKQLREQYDYVIFAYSGGSDSSNALKTFLYNNIKIDELLVWYTSYNENTVLTNQEIIHAGSHMINKVHKEYNIKITKFDNRQVFAQLDLGGRDWILGTDPTLVIEQVCKPKMLFENPEWVRLVENGKSVAIVMGLEKPRIFYNNEKWYAGFLDVINAYNWEIYHINRPPVTIESFYSGVGMPEITIAQSHVLAKHLEQKYTKKQLQTNFNKDGNFKQEQYFREVRLAIYPYWNDDTFSIGKDLNGVLHNKYKWVWESNTTLSQRYFDGLKLVENEVDDYWLNHQGNIFKGFRGVWSKFYCLN